MVLYISSLKLISVLCADNLETSHAWLIDLVRECLEILTLRERDNDLTATNAAIQKGLLLYKECKNNITALRDRPGGGIWRLCHSRLSHVLAILSTMKTVTLLKFRPVDCHSTDPVGEIKKAIYHLDMDLITTGGWPHSHYIHEILDLLNDLLPLVLPDNDADQRRYLALNELKVPTLTHPGPTLHHPGFTEFRDRVAAGEPFKMTGMIAHWPVFNDARPSEEVEGGSLTNRVRSKWSSIPYLYSKTLNGMRYVPVEIGKTYLDDAFEQKIMSFNEYLIKYVLQEAGKEGSPKGYLAQHNLLDQIPALGNDIEMFPYIQHLPSSSRSTTTTTLHYQSTEDDDDDPPSKTIKINVWLGPAGTITPIHHDPYDNIFCQVSGTKYIRLYHPTEIPESLRLGKDHRGISQNNSCCVPVEWVEGGDEIKETLEYDEEREMWEVFRRARYVDFVVREGESVFFPRGWWHYVRAVSGSFSVNFWWYDA